MTATATHRVPRCPAPQVGGRPLDTVGIIVRVDAASKQVSAFPVGQRPTALNTAAFDGAGALWFTGQNGWLGRLDPKTEAFTPIPVPAPGANVRPLLGRSGELSGAESGTDKLAVVRTGC